VHAAPFAIRHIPARPDTSSMSNPNETLDRLAERAGQLYSLPAVAMKVLELTSNPQIDTRALKECIENDPALTGKLLRVVNSSLFGLSRQVSDLNQALALLGTKPLKLLVLGFSLPAGLYAGVAADVLARYWRHTLTKAVGARELSETLWTLPGDEAFIAGLLQDIGMLVLIQQLGEPYLQFVEKAVAAGGDLKPLETEAMGFDHAMLSARLLAQWGLPEALVFAVSPGAPGREQPELTPAEESLPAILDLAGLLARLLADEQKAVLPELLEAGHRLGRLGPQQLESLVERLREKVGQLADVFNLQLPEGMDYRDLLVEAHAQLSTVAAEAAGEMAGGRSADETEPAQVRLADETLALADETLALADAVAALGEGPDALAVPAVQPVATTADTIGQTAAASARHSAGPAVATVRSRSTDPGLVGHLQRMVMSCRSLRCGLSLLLAEPVEADQLVPSLGPAGVEQLRNQLQQACLDMDHSGQSCVPYGEYGFALILPNCERSTAVDYGYEISERLRAATVPAADGFGQVIAAVGVATVALPPKNFPAGELLAAAERCLFASLASDGRVVKSIEIY